MTGDGSFERELAHARELLDGDDVTAVSIAVIRDGEEIDTTFAQRSDADHEAGLQALSLLAAQVRLVATRAGVDHTAVASDAASIAGAVDELDPASLASGLEDDTDGEE